MKEREINREEYNDPKRLFVRPQDENEIRHIVKREITKWLWLYFLGGLGVGFIIAYLVLILWR